jgi:hypothetical protein
MRHVNLACKNHPELRWTCKAIATSSVGGYNGARNIFYQGHTDGTYPPECKCAASDLILAPGEIWQGVYEDD